MNWTVTYLWYNTKVTRFTNEVTHVLIVLPSPPSPSCSWWLPSLCSSSSPPPVEPSPSPSPSPLRGNSARPRVVRGAGASGRGATGRRSGLAGWNIWTVALWASDRSLQVLLRLCRHPEAPPTHRVRQPVLLSRQTIPDISGTSGSRWMFQPRDGCRWAWRRWGPPAPSCPCWAPQTPKLWTSFPFPYSP